MPIYFNAKEHRKVIYRCIRTVTASARVNISRATSRHDLRGASPYSTTRFTNKYTRARVYVYKWTQSLINIFRDRDES